MAKTRGYNRHHQVQVIQIDIVGVILAAISVELTSVILNIFVCFVASFPRNGTFATEISK